MEDNKKGTRKRITRVAHESHAEKVDYSTSRSYDFEEARPYRAERTYSSDRPRYNSDKPRYSSDKPRYGSDKTGYGSDKPRYGSDKPRYGSDKTGHGSSDRPRYNSDKPRYGSDKPRYGSGDRAYGKPSRPRTGGKRNETSGIDAMLSRKPQIDRYAYSDNDSAATPIKEIVRLNKFIANSGVCSRREADTLIQSGVVTVNGEVITELGTKVNVLTDDIRFNGERLKGEDKVYIVMNKPKGYVTTASDPHAEKTVMDLIKGCPKRVFPVGRLDKNTTGVLMFTNDGEMAEKLTHPSYNKKKIYQVIVDQPLAEEDKQKILEGVELSDGIIKADELEYVDPKDHRKLGIEIHSGKNRIVRRIFESLGYDVRALDRVYFAGLTKKGLKKGDWRYLTEGEVNILKMGAYV